MTTRDLQLQSDVITVSSHEAGVSNTQFLAVPFAVEIASPPTAENTLWGIVHRSLESSRAIAPLPVVDTRDGELMEFDSWTLHRAMPVRIRGWRLFFRVSMWHRRGLGEGGEGCVSRQEQVYKLVESEGDGW